jgi:hypothetical protein
MKGQKMTSKKLLPGIVLLLVGIAVSANAEVLCYKPNGAAFVRTQCSPNEQQFNPGLQVSFSEAERTDVVLGPGEELIVAAGCGAGQVVISGGYVTDESGPPLRVTTNAAFFDGVNSGWRVDFLNEADTTVTVSTAVIVSCSNGTGIIGSSSGG